MKSTSVNKILQQTLDSPRPGTDIYMTGIYCGKVTILQVALLSTAEKKTFIPIINVFINNVNRCAIPFINDAFKSTSEILSLQLMVVVVSLSDQFRYEGYFTLETMLTVHISALDSLPAFWYCT